MPGIKDNQERALAAAGVQGNAIRRVCQAAVALSLAIWLILLWRSLHREIWIDDSYMFYRYAMNVRHGLGLSWNLDGVHTYGETALLWGFVVLLLSYLPLTASQALCLGWYLTSGRSQV